MTTMTALQIERLAPKRAIPSLYARRSGWRLTGGLWHDTLGVKLAHVDLVPGSPTFGHYDPAECRPDRYPTPHAAHGMHAPDPRCSCGYHVVPELPDLLAWPDYPHRDTAASTLARGLAGYADEVVPFWCVVTVTAWGRMEPAAPGAGDPPGTFRAEFLALTGALILDETAPPGVAPLLTSAGLSVERADLDALAGAA
ncbi:hypothetical protein [Nocardioides jishulii]|uniref:Uncharacterized protein n=1 Tax=Nocardioides jishulii TaxID=2575440 RepID=A0A4U2YI90_9ACTN|nr:hypothetical protein [Nocardioides jishulii]QCX28085.1 hypothetical protein FCL41_11570 [Nocardioides jishulii]TKI60749.1 hypothetical protein FC770_14645 [Nocardioides jishulii]